MRSRPALALALFVLCLGILLTVYLPNQHAHASDETFVRVFAPKEIFATPQNGVILWHEYGAFALYKVRPQVLATLPPAERQRVRILNEAPPLLFANGALDPRAPTAAVPTAWRAPTASQGAALHLVQFVGPIKDEWLATLEKVGATPVHYVAQNGYIVWADEAARARLDALAREGEILQFSMPHQPYFKIAPVLLTRLEQTPAAETIVTITVQLYRHAGAAQTQKQIDALAVRRLSEWTPVLQYANATLDVHLDDVATIAAMPDVMWVEEYLPRERFDEVQTQLIAGHFTADQSAPTGPGYLAWLDSLGFSQNPADYPIVDIVDDGVGDGTLDTGDPTLHEFGQAANPSRAVYIANCTSAPNGGGLDGHGHINASIAFGYDTRAGFPYRDPLGFQRGLGVNPYGRFAATRVFSPYFDLSACGNSDTGLIKHLQDSGAHISSNSWGCPTCSTTYDASAQAFDIGTRDADLTEPGNQEMLFIFAAGNSGPESGSIGSPGNAKNVLTVGASENVRPDDEDGTWVDGCFTDATSADNAMDIADFSSRGPAPGNRTKPEVVAPGTHVQGTASTHPGYTGSGVCDAYRPSGQTIFAASSGTSHSTPAVAGVASLVYYWLQHVHAIPTPSPALLKAYIMAHTTYLTGVAANDTLPSNAQGYGMPNLEMAFDATPRLFVNQSVLFNATGETWTLHGAVADPTKPVVIVLNYTDAPGALGTSPQVNDLDLEVLVDGTLYRGNVFNGQWSAPGGAPDTVNNYEVIRLPAGTSSALSITITASNIAGDGVPNQGDATDQDFALVCYNCAQTFDFVLQATPPKQAVCAPESATYDITAFSILGYADPVTLSVSGAPSGTLPLFSANPITPTASSTLTISNTAAAAFGAYTLDIVGVAPTSTHTTTVQLALFTAPPEAPTLLAPANGATSIPRKPTLTWNDGSQAVGAFIEIATDATFATPVYTATITPGVQSHTLATALDYDTTYYWRVRNTNPCGEGAYSDVFTFTTETTPPILLVDDDDNDPDMRAFYTSTLETLGVSFDVWDTAQSDNEPTSADLAPYTVVIWFSGDAFGSPTGPSEASEAALSSWLESGNRCLFMSSQDYHWARQLTLFMKNYLGVAGIVDDVNYSEVIGQGNIFGPLGTYTLDYTAINSHNWSDTITPTLDANVVYMSEKGPAAVQRQTATYRTMYWGFSFEALSTQQDRLANMQAVLTWCETPLPERPKVFLPFVVR
ncbi:S8 family serine peptidase [Ardenticatena maritima]|uniref:Fibronectin type-III domain-containing protein n=1 Tax=Ardenticatena maritima TaxID=872965 RepID=A0A0P6Y193_9CHLR|nr:S8 family serine peptidase [Ardenticatena maritima]KPL89651.1 hypothetical protein SE16_04400 [Ardenticatena maritima]